MDILHLRIPRFKLIEEPLIPLLDRYVDVANFLIMFFLIGLSIYFSIKLKGPKRQIARRSIQLSSMLIFFFVFAQMWCGFRNEVLGFLNLGVDNYWAFSFLYLWLMVLCSAVLFGRYFCGFICPAGFIQELTGSIVKKFETYLPWMKSKIYKVLVLVFAVWFIIEFTIKTKPLSFFFVEDAAVLFTLALCIICLILVFMPKVDKALRRFKYVAALAMVLLSLLGMRITGAACNLYMNDLDYSSTIATVGIWLTVFAVPQSYCKFLCPFGAFFRWIHKLPFIRIIHKGLGIEDSLLKASCHAGAIGNKSINSKECLHCFKCADSKHNHNNAISIDIKKPDSITK